MYFDGGKKVKEEQNKKLNTFRPRSEKTTTGEIQYPDLDVVVLEMA